MGQKSNSTCVRINWKDVGIFMKNIKLGQTKFLNMAYLGSNIILNFAGVRKGAKSFDNWLLGGKADQ